MIVLADGHAHVEVHPELGAAIGRYDVVTSAGANLPIFQLTAAPGRQGPFALGLNLLVPFSNRLSGGGFRHGGAFHPLPRNTAGPYPIHGNAFALPWTVQATSDTSVQLHLRSDGPGPFRYDAEVAYALRHGALHIRLLVVNRAANSLPFGAGLHPWFVRSPGARLRMTTTGYWTETPDHLPDVHLPTAGDAGHDYTQPRTLPQAWINTAFTGWDGQATLTWPDRRLAVDIAAGQPLTTIIVYSPSKAADFVCIEPVSHSVDAHNRADPGTAPPQILEPGAALSVETTITPYAL